MNHWQVIMGNLQLQQPEKALAYMRETIVIQEQEQKLALLHEPVLAAILLGLIIGLQQQGITTNLEFPEAIEKGPVLARALARRLCTRVIWIH